MHPWYFKLFACITLIQINIFKKKKTYELVKNSEEVAQDLVRKNETMKEKLVDWDMEWASMIGVLEGEARKNSVWKYSGK